MSPSASATDSDEARRATGPDDLEADSVAKALKERLYVAIVGLSILIAISEHNEHLSAGHVAAALTVGVVASVLAAVLAEVIAHIAVHRHLPAGGEALHIVRSASWALLVVVLPLGLLALAGLDVMATATAVDAATWTIVIVGLQVLAHG